MKRQIPYFIRRRALRGIIFYGLCSLLNNPPCKNTEILVSIRRMLPSLLMRTAVRSMCNILVAVSLTDNGSQLMLVQKVSCIHATLLPKPSESSVSNSEDVSNVARFKRPLGVRHAPRTLRTRQAKN